MQGGGVARRAGLDALHGLRFGSPLLANGQGAACQAGHRPPAAALYLLGVMVAVEAQRFESHLLDCHDCQAECDRVGPAVDMLAMLGQTCGDEVGERPRRVGDHTSRPATTDSQP